MAEDGSSPLSSPQRSAPLPMYMTRGEMDLILLEKKCIAEADYVGALEARQRLLKMREDTAREKSGELGARHKEEADALTAENAETLKSLRESWDERVAAHDEESEAKRQDLKERQESEMAAFEEELEEAMGRVKVKDSKEVQRLQHLRQEAVGKQEVQRRRSAAAGGEEGVSMQELLSKGSNLVYGGDAEREALRSMVEGQIGTHIAADKVAEIDLLIESEREHCRALGMAKASWNRDRLQKQLKLKHEKAVGALELRLLRTRDDLCRDRKAAEGEVLLATNKKAAELRIRHRAELEALAREVKMLSLAAGGEPKRPPTSAGLLQASISGPQSREKPSWRQG
mmetsp:Transcript_65204/g.205990  ORF Transcript_65204/g.205990 Transcript_65204/m.205990 type:complete len:343 (+) Transcript_65204:322-1350(+)